LITNEKTGLDDLIAVSSDLYMLQNRIAYLIAFKNYLLSKVKKTALVKRQIDANALDEALINVTGYVQRCRFGAAVELLKKDSPDLPNRL